MSGKSRMLRSVAGSIFFASQCAAALSRTADMLVRNCTKMGTEVLYIEIVIESVSFARRRNGEEWKLNELRSSQSRVSIEATMSAQGQTLRSQSSPTAQFVRY